MTLLSEKIRTLQRNLQDETVRRTSIPQLERRAEFFVTLFEKYLPEESHILDIGGGWGFYADPLVKRGHRLTVMDAAKPSYQRAPVVLCEPGKSFPFPDKSFDASLMITMLHHTPDPEAIIKEARRVTRNVVVIVEDVYRNPAGKLWTILRDQILNFEYFGHPCKFKSNAEWKEVFKRNGLRLIKENEMYTWLAGFRILNDLYVLEVER